MKHPVDTSRWGEFLLNDIATLTNGNKFDKNKMSHDKPSINFVSRTGFNNGISDFVDKIDGTEPYPAGAITLALGGSVGSTFVQPKPFYTGQNVGVIEFDNKSEKMKQFVAVVLNKVCSTQFSAFKNEINKHFKRDLSIPLPLKPFADPSNYDSTDIDWDYMETVMSRVTTRAKERLANLPQPTDKKKTLVDTSSWGEFDIIALFDIINTKSIRQSDVQDQLQSNNGSTPYITASDKNNAILAHIDCPQEWIDEGNCIFIGGKTTTITYQSQDFCSNDSHNLALYLKNEQARTKYIQLYLASILKKAFAKYHWGDALSKAKIKAETIKLPLKPSADPSNYTQEDIDWDYMGRFMQAIEEKAHERVASLKERTNEDD